MAGAAAFAGAGAWVFPEEPLAVIVPMPVLFEVHENNMGIQSGAEWMAMLVNEVWYRRARELGARDISSYIAETDGTRRLLTEFYDGVRLLAAAVVRDGGVPFPVPVEIENAALPLLLRDAPEAA